MEDRVNENTPMTPALFTKGVPHVFMLMTGMHVIARFDREENGNYFVTKPLMINMVPNKHSPGTIDVQLAPMASPLNPSPNKVAASFNASWLLDVFVANRDLANAYNAQTSGLVMPGMRNFNPANKA